TPPPPRAGPAGVGGGGGGGRPPPRGGPRRWPSRLPPRVDRRGAHGTPAVGGAHGSPRTSTLPPGDARGDGAGGTRRPGTRSHVSPSLLPPHRRGACDRGGRPAPPPRRAPPPPSLRRLPAPR